MIFRFPSWYTWAWLSNCCYYNWGRRYCVNVWWWWPCWNTKLVRSVKDKKRWGRASTAYMGLWPFWNLDQTFKRINQESTNDSRWKESTKWPFSQSLSNSKTYIEKVCRLKVFERCPRMDWSSYWSNKELRKLLAVLEWRLRNKGCKGCRQVQANKQKAKARIV